MRASYFRNCGLTFTTRGWWKTCHENAALNTVPRVRFKFKEVLFRTLLQLIAANLALICICTDQTIFTAQHIVSSSYLI